MLDPQLLRADINSVAAELGHRGYTLDIEAYQALEARRKDLQQGLQELQNQRNTSAKSIGQAKSKGEDIQPLLERDGKLGEALTRVEDEFKLVRDEQRAWQLEMPNIAAGDVPRGTDESDNVEIRNWGTPPEFEFEPRDHVELGQRGNLLDADAAAKISGARFTVLRADLALLHRALAQFMLDVHTGEHGYMELYLPYLVNPEAMLGTGQLPKFGDEAFTTTDEPPRYLVPTAEVPMTNLAAGNIYEADELPLRYTSQTPCFRREAGAHGKDTRGMMRQHQFEKVELVQIVKPENSAESLEELTVHAETILQKLGLAYRVMVLATGDMGFAACKTHDIEVWLPGQGAYREISSCSNCGDFQARRMQARWRDPDSKKPQLVHTLNGSGLAVGRALIAVMENYQQRDGSIRIPDVLRPYMGGKELINS